MPTPRISRRIGGIPWKKVAQTFTLLPRLDRRRGRSAALSPEAALARDWETVTKDMAVVMGDLATAWQVVKRDIDAKLAQQPGTRQPGVQ